MRKSLSIQTMFRDRVFYDRFRLVREAGFDYLEFGEWPGLDLRRIEELQSEYLLRIASISGDRFALPRHGERCDDYLEYLSQSLAVARFCHCQNLIIHSVHDTVEGGSGIHGGNFARVVEATRILLDASKMAEGAGVTLHLKALDHVPGAGALWAGDAVRVVGSPRLRLLYDVRKALSLDGDVLPTLQKYHDLIEYVHIGAVDRAWRGMDWARVAKKLADFLDHTVIVGFEVPCTGDPEPVLDAIRAF